MKLKVFSSGSAGNCSLLRTNEYNILIDAGITKKLIEENLEASGLTLNDINYVFYTHEHIDHIRAFDQLLKYPEMKIVITDGTLSFITDGYRRNDKTKLLTLVAEKLQSGNIIIVKRIDDTIMYPVLNFGRLNVQVLPLFHDAREPIGFVFEEEERRLCYITDTGYVHSDVMLLITNCEAYVLESNHDPELLMASDRPYYTKLRIVGDHGHLSNEDSMYILTRVMGDKTNLVLHAHVSQECNLSILITGKRKEVFEQYGINENNYDFEILGLSPTKEFEI